MKRVVYRNSFDGTMRVLAGQLTDEQAKAVRAKWGNPKDAYFYMGKEVAVEECDSTPDGAVLKEVAR